MMCGRISCYFAPEDLSCSCKHKDVAGKEREVSWVAKKFRSVTYVPSYNMGPRDSLACITAGSHFNDEAERVLCPMMWGMIPPWHKGEYKRHTVSSHNGRLENLKNSKLYGKPLNEGKRCAIVVNGFYEWKTDKETGKKQPYYMYKRTGEDGVSHREVLTLAGLFDKWTSQEGETIYSCTILTTAANDVLSWLHHRAPVVLQTEKDVHDWLACEEVSAVEALAKLRSTDLSASALQWHPVASTVNNVRNKDKSCVERVGNATKSAAGGSMSAWLKTGSLGINKRKSTDFDDDSDSAGPKAKAFRKV